VTPHYFKKLLESLDRKAKEFFLRDYKSQVAFMLRRQLPIHLNGFKNGKIWCSQE